MEVEAYKSRLLCVLFKYQSNTYIPYETLYIACRIMGCYISSTSSMRESKLGANAVPAGELTYTSWIISPGAYCHIHNHLSPLIPLCVT